MDVSEAWNISKSSRYCAVTSQCVPGSELQPSDLDTLEQARVSMSGGHLGSCYSQWRSIQDSQ